MKRTLAIAVLTLCLFISSLSGLNAQAQEVDIDGDLLGGVFYITLADDDIEDDITATLSINGLVGSGAFNISEAAEIAEVDIYGRAGNANNRILETGLEGDWGDVDDTVDLSGIEIGVGMSFAF